MEGATFKAKHLNKLAKLVMKKEQHQHEPKKKKGNKSSGDEKVDKTNGQKIAKNRKKETSLTLTTSKDKKSTRSQKLADHCKKHLEYSHFRAMNEFIYSNPSGKGFDYMKDQDRFRKYHQAYEEIVRKWPVKPVDFIIKKIEEIGGPDSNREWIIADLGCGRVPLLKQRLPKAKVHSFDVMSTHRDVIAANIEDIPLKNHAVDIAVFSLSLMATNVRDLILEANRILRNNGILMIAEVSSRFEEETLDKFEEKLEEYGFKVVEKQFLPPNDFFVYLTANKKKDIIKSASRDLSDINLKPCLYKPR